MGRPSRERANLPPNIADIVTVYSDHTDRRFGTEDRPLLFRYARLAGNVSGVIEDRGAGQGDVFFLERSSLLFMFFAFTLYEHQRRIRLVAGRIFDGWPGNIGSDGGSSDQGPGRGSGG